MRGSRGIPSRTTRDHQHGEVAKRSNAADCKSVALAASKVRILPSPPAFARFASDGQAGEQSTGDVELSDARVHVARVGNGNLAGLPRRSRARRVASRRRACGLAPPKLRAERAVNEGGSNSVVESQPSKLLVAGSIPVSRSSFGRGTASRRTPSRRPSRGPQAPLRSGGRACGARVMHGGEWQDDAANERKRVSRASGVGNQGPHEGARRGVWRGEAPQLISRCSSVGRARPW